MRERLASKCRQRPCGGIDAYFAPKSRYNRKSQKMNLPLKTNNCTTTNLDDVDAKGRSLVFVIWVVNKVFKFVLLG
jgi:hypothetical protein